MWWIARMKDAYVQYSVLLTSQSEWGPAYGRLVKSGVGSFTPQTQWHDTMTSVFSHEAYLRNTVLQVWDHVGTIPSRISIKSHTMRLEININILLPQAYTSWSFSLCSKLHVQKGCHCSWSTRAQVLRSGWCDILHKRAPTDRMNCPSCTNMKVQTRTDTYHGVKNLQSSGATLAGNLRVRLKKQENGDGDGH